MPRLPTTALVYAPVEPRDAVRVQAGAVAGSLARFVAPLPPTALSEVAIEAFASDSALYAIPVVDAAGRPVGLLNRFKFLERLSHRFGRALTATKQVEQFMEPAPLTLDESTPIDEIGELFVASDNPFVFDGFIVTRGGRYLATGTGLDLMRALSDRRHTELLFQARHDILTGLPNRHLFDLNLFESLHEGLPVALLFIDLDHFKHVNDTFGHGVGDRLLRTIADRLHAAIRPEDTAARLGGDEFAAILRGVNDAATAESIAATILAKCSAPVEIGDYEIIVSCSIGVALCPEDASTAEELVQAADSAVYQAKQVRNSFQRYSADVSQTGDGVAISLADLRHAIDRGELTVHYQPKVDLRSERICGVEALLRWQHPAGHQIQTEELVKVAEDSGLIIQISEQVIRTAMRDVLAWETASGRRDLTLAVNISSVQMREGGLVSMLDRIVAETGFDRRRLELELTESAAMRAGKTAATLQCLKQRGYTLAIDDFGTGYSSLSQLERLPVNVLKIDKSFVGGIGQPGRNGAIVKAIIALGHSLGLQLVAEGVETPAQLALLRGEGCDIAQGYLLGRPVSSAELQAQLTQGLPPRPTAVRRPRELLRGRVYHATPAPGR